THLCSYLVVTRSSPLLHVPPATHSPRLSLHDALPIWRTERPAPDERDAAGAELAGRAVDLRHAERFLFRKRRHNAGQPLGEHRLARARRSGHEQIMASGRGRQDGALGGRLAEHVGEVGLARAAAYRTRPGACTACIRRIAKRRPDAAAAAAAVAAK